MSRLSAVKCLTVLAAVLVLISGQSAAQNGMAATITGGGKPTLAVLDLEPKGVSRVEASAVSEMLRDKIAETGTHQVVERSRIASLIEEMQIQQSGLTTPEEAAKTGQMLGAQRLVVGSVGKLGNTYIISARTVDVATGKVVCSASEKVKGEIDAVVENAVPVIAVQLVGFTREQVKQYIKEKNLKDLFVREAAKPVKLLRVGCFVGGVGAVAAGVGVLLYSDNIYNSKYVMTTDGHEAETLRKQVTSLDLAGKIVLGAGCLLLAGGGVTFAF